MTVRDNDAFLSPGDVKQTVYVTVVSNYVLSRVWWSVIKMSHQGLPFLESSPRLLPEKMNENERN